MRKSNLTDEQVEQEIKRLWATDEVKLAKKEQNLKYQRRSQLYMLRNMEKRGAELMACGITFDNIKQVMFNDDGDNITE